MTAQESIPANIAALLRVLSHAKVAVFSQDADLRYRWIENPPRSWNASDVAGKSEIDILPAKAAALATSFKRELLINNGRPRWSELIVEADGGTTYFDLYLEAERDNAGAIVGVTGIAVDVTDRRKQAETMDAVARDLSHRTKNLLAVIQGLAAQTARSSASTEAFIESFRGRIQSISRSQDLSIEAKRHGAKLADLVHTQVHPYIADIDGQFAFTGEDRYLTANGALHVGLALYELCISAVRSGALTEADGKVTVAAEIVAEPDGGRPPRLEVTWRESVGPLAEPLEGFSKVLLERIVPAAVGGEATLTETAPGRCYALSIAASEYE